MQNSARSNIKAMVEKLLKNEWVTTSDAIVLGSYAYASDSELPRISQLLTELTASLQEIKTTYELQKNQALGHCLSQIDDVKHQAQRLDLVIQERTSSVQDSAQQNALLNQLNTLSI